ncbi:MAG: hypothetical protein ACI89U_000589, partial [Gammaproteobacteria bacterium]
NRDWRPHCSPHANIKDSTNHADDVLTFRTVLGCKALHLANKFDK